MTSGFELFSRVALERILVKGIKSRAHFFQTEIRAYCHGMRIREVPISYCNRSPGINGSILFESLCQLGRLTILRFIEIFIFEVEQLQGEISMNPATSLVVTSIGRPNGPLRALAEVATKQSWHFYLIGDQASPADFHLEGCDFYDLRRQIDSGFEYARSCPTNHYARKNIGYLMAFREGAQAIVETDDDNLPCQPFGNPRSQQVNASLVLNAGWLNIYHYYSNDPVWPRGFPLDAIRDAPPEFRLPSRRNAQSSKA